MSNKVLRQAVFLLALVAAMAMRAETVQTFVSYTVSTYKGDNQNRGNYSLYLLTAGQAGSLVYGDASRSVDSAALAAKVSSLFDNGGGAAAAKAALSGGSVNLEAGSHWWESNDQGAYLHVYITAKTEGRLMPDLYENGGFAVSLYTDANGNNAYVVGDRSYISYKEYTEKDRDSVGAYLHGSGEVAAQYTPAVWQTAASGLGSIPEPTSGMLVLLGLSGLALRRKRA